MNALPQHRKTRAALRSAVCALGALLALLMVGRPGLVALLAKRLDILPRFHSRMLPVRSAYQIMVLQSSIRTMRSPPGVELNVETNFYARAPLPEQASLVLSLIDANGHQAAEVTNDLNNRFTILPTTSWLGPITLLISCKIPRLNDGVYSLVLALYTRDAHLQLSAGPGVMEDSQFRYKIGSLNVDHSAPQPTLLPPPTLDLTGYHLTFDESFTALSISDAPIYDGARWYAKNEECCMSTTDGTATAMAGVSSRRNPFSLLPGGGLNIRLQRVANSWTSGVLTSVDSRGRGFSQQFGYFEMRAKFPPGENTWPAFWLLNTASKQRGAPAGEIDIVEYIANPSFRNYISTTLHDWSDGTAPAASHNRVPLPTDGFHTYGMMWTATTMTFYFDGSVTMRCPTPSIMKQPYYLLVDLGIGSGWPTENTPYSNDMDVNYIRVYSK